jgi:DNA-binding Lrp family transcriptional regulator
VALTKRRREFLSKTNTLYQDTGQPVHYTTVAQALGVSKWTAYDILSELESEGLLNIEYAVIREERNSGRSQVFFLPTDRAQHILQEETIEISGGEDWLMVKERLLSMFDNIIKIDSKKIMEELLEEMRTLEVPITFSAYTITLLIVYIRSLGNRSIQSIENLLQLAPKPEQMLSLFTGAVLGTMVRNMREAINTAITTKVGKFHKHVSEFNGQEKKLLVSFLEEALQRATV